MISSETLIRAMYSALLNAEDRLSKLKRRAGSDDEYHYENIVKAIEDCRRYMKRSGYEE